MNGVLKLEAKRNRCIIASHNLANLSIIIIVGRESTDTIARRVRGRLGQDYCLIE